MTNRVATGKHTAGQLWTPADHFRSSSPMLALVQPIRKFLDAEEVTGPILARSGKRYVHYKSVRL